MCDVQLRPDPARNVSPPCCSWSCVAGSVQEAEGGQGVRCHVGRSFSEEGSEFRVELFALCPVFRTLWARQLDSVRLIGVLASCTWGKGPLGPISKPSLRLSRCRLGLGSSLDRYSRSRDRRIALLHSTLPLWKD